MVVCGREPCVLVVVGEAELPAEEVGGLEALAVVVVASSAERRLRNSSSSLCSGLVVEVVVVIAADVAEGAEPMPVVFGKS